MNRDRLTSKGWTWHQGLVRFLEVEEAMFQCANGCTSCEEHSGELESATRYATRSIQQPVPHMDKVMGAKLRAMPNRELGSELDRWADNRDRFPNLDSIALRVTANRLRAMEEGCDHPLGAAYRTKKETFCQECGAIIDEDGETVNKWTVEAEPKYAGLIRQRGVSTPDKRSYAAEEAAWHESMQRDARREATEQESVRGGSRADGPLTKCATAAHPDDPCNDGPNVSTSTGRLSSEQVEDLGKLHVTLGTLATDLENVANTLGEASKAVTPVKNVRIAGMSLRCGKVFPHHTHPWGMKKRLECNGHGELNQPPNAIERVQ